MVGNVATRFSEHQVVCCSRIRAFVAASRTLLVVPASLCPPATVLAILLHVCVSVCVSVCVCVRELVTHFKCLPGGSDTQFVNGRHSRVHSGIMTSKNVPKDCQNFLTSVTPEELCFQNSFQVFWMGVSG